MVITVNNVKHGDFISLELDNDILVTRDFGSLDNYVNQNIEFHLQKFHRRYIGDGFYPHRFLHFDQYEAILTHPHKDHLSGYEAMYKLNYRNFYDKAYIPYLDYNTPYHSLLLKTAVCFMLTMFPQKTLKIQGWVKAAPLMSFLSKELVYVHQGCNAFDHWNPKGTILWPPLPNDSFYDKRKKKLEDMLDVFSDNVKERADSIYKELSRILSSISEKKDFQEYEPMEYGKERPKDERKEDAYSIVSTLLENIAGTIENKKEQNLEKICSEFGSLIDDHSIAFSVDAPQGAALFLSDFNDGAMNRMKKYMVNSNIGPSFYFIKSAHHGTRLGNKLAQYLSTSQAEYVVHCCGPSPPQYCGPSPKYSNLAKQIFCTDWNNASSKWQKKTKYQIFKQIYNRFVIN